MAGSALLQVSLIAILGIGAYWLADRTQLPSILLLLLAGVVAGPVTGWVDPDALFGDLLTPFVALSVAIILFEGGLSLRTIELRQIGTPVRNLVSIGVVITWLTASGAAHYLVGLNWGLALLLGAILSVTGPTVIIPLIRQIRPKGAVGKVLKWEGILIDPIGVILSVLVLEVLLAGGLQEATMAVALTIAKALGAGFVIGTAGALVAYLLLKRHWVGDHLESPIVLGLVVAVFLLCELVQVESGLVGATVMGMVLANRGNVAKRHIVEFKETLRVLLISFLFVVLAARLPPSAIDVVSLRSVAFVVLLFVVVRPLSVVASTIGTELSWKERGFLAWMAPRGIVAASIASVFALELQAAGIPGAQQLVSLAFLAIIATVAVYGLTAGPLARWLDVADPDPQGILLVGGPPWARELAKRLDEAGVTVRIMDTNRHNLEAAKEEGLDVQHADSVTEHTLEQTSFTGIGNVFAITANDETNKLTALNFQEAFDRSNVYQLTPERGMGSESTDLSGRILFDRELTASELVLRTREGWSIETLPIPPEADDAIVDEIEDEPGFPLVVVGIDGNTVPIAEGQPFNPSPGDWVIRLVPPDDHDEEDRGEDEVGDED